MRLLSSDWLMPAWENDFLFVLNDGSLISKCAITRLLRESGLRLGLDPSVLDTHSLRAGGCTAMADAGFPEHEINAGRYAAGAPVSLGRMWPTGWRELPAASLFAHLLAGARAMASSLSGG
jgi:hypothetical protein